MQFRSWMIAAGLAAWGAGAAQAAAYIKFDGVDGESKVEVSWKVEKGEKVAPDNSDSEGYTGGVHVASGDVTGDGAADAPASPPAGRKFSNITLKRGVADSNDQASPPGTPGDLFAPAPDPQAVGLLLPAVQKVREAAAARPDGMACEVGATLRNLIIRNEDTAQIVRVPSAMVSACSAEQISLNFSKVEAMRPAKRRIRMRE